LRNKSGPESRDKMAALVALHAGYSCRPWQKEDRNTVGEIIQVVLEEYGLPFEPLGEDKDALCVEDFYWQEDKGEFWVVLDPAGTVVGTSAFLQSHQGPKCVEIRKMYLLPRARGQGLGNALLRLMEERIQLKGYESMYVQTATVLKEACSMYKKAGYRINTSGAETPRCDILLSKPVQSTQ